MRCSRNTHRSRNQAPFGERGNSAAQCPCPRCFCGRNCESDRAASSFADSIRLMLMRSISIVWMPGSRSKSTARRMSLGNGHREMQCVTPALRPPVSEHFAFRRRTCFGTLKPPWQGYLRPALRGCPSTTPLRGAVPLPETSSGRILAIDLITSGTPRSGVPPRSGLRGTPPAPGPARHASAPGRSRHRPTAARWRNRDCLHPRTSGGSGP